MKKEELERIRDLVTGERDYLLERYQKIFIKGEHDEKIRNEKDKIFKTYLLVIICLILIISGYAAGRTDFFEHVSFSGKHAVSIERAEDKTLEMEFDVGVLTDEGAENHDVTLRITPSEEGEDAAFTDEDDDETKSIEELVREMASSVEDSPSKTIIMLPDRLNDGTPVMWFKHNDYGWILIILGFAAIMVMIYMSRFDHVKKEEEKARNSIIFELPGFINKLVLLLNGGLVLSDAFERAVERKSSDSYFYTQLENILSNCEQSNTPMELQLSEFAKNTGVREFIRVSGIITDNVQKGTYLVEKLEAESSVLWFGRKKKAEELGKLAETRLTLPLMILLMVLIMVTIAPALLEM